MVINGLPENLACYKPPPSRANRAARRWPPVAPVLLLAALSAGPAQGRAESMDQPLLVVTGDFDGDGLSDKVQGFPEASDAAGRVDVYWGAAAFKVAWPTVLSAIKSPRTRLASGRLGEALAVGDFNGDRLDDLAIGAPHADSTGGPILHTHSGSVVVIYGCSPPACQSVQSSGAGSPAGGSALDPTIAAGALRITASQAVSFGRFGKSLAAGDFDDDGYDDLAIGAPGDTVDGTLKAGSVTIIRGSSSGLDLADRTVLHQNDLPAGASPAEAEDHFGSALSAARLDLDDDDDLVVGVPDEDYGDEVSPGEVNVFWGGADGLTPSSYVSFRHTHRYGRRGQKQRSPGIRSSSVRLHRRPDGQTHSRAGSSSASPRRRRAKATTALSASPGLGPRHPEANLECSVDISATGSVAGDGALPEIPVNFIVIANWTTFPRNLLWQPTTTWTGPDPITGQQISGADFFKAEIDLLNQQLRADDGSPVCDGKDCLRLAYRSHTYYSSSMFETAGKNVCPKLHAIAEPLRNQIDESSLAITENCTATTCPRTSGAFSSRYAAFSDFANAAVDECSLLTDDEALNVIIYDVCGRKAGEDGKENTDDDDFDCVDFRNGRARTNDGHPYMFLDYERALKPRTPATLDPSAAEEHEAGHAFGIHHACDPDGSANTHVMESSKDCNRPSTTPNPRNSGFATLPRNDDDGHVVLEVGKLVETAREHVPSTSASTSGASG